MIRRVVSVQSRRSMTALVPATVAAMQTRQFWNSWDLVWSAGTCTFCMTAFACWGNDLAGAMKFGLWRYRRQLDEPIKHQDFALARWIGAFIGFIFYWYWAGPQKYFRNPELEYRWSNIRIGPL